MSSLLETSAIVVMETGVHVRDLVIARQDVADYLRAIPQEERALAFIHAVEVGVFCLERARAGADLEFVRRQVDSLLIRVQQDVAAVPAAIEKQLIEKIGTSDGQVLAPVQLVVTQTSDAMKQRVEEVKQLFGHELDPSKATSTLGAALTALKDLLDPKRKDSIQASFEEAVQRVTSQDGTLATAVKLVVAAAAKPLADEVEKLANEIRERKAVAEIIERTTEKGTPFEEVIVARLQPWARIAGADVHHVGLDNRTGDIVLALPPQPGDEKETRLVIEVRDRESQAFGRKQISDKLTEAMAERNATAAVYLSRFPDGLAKEIKGWCEGSCERGPFIATTEENLAAAVRLVLVLQRVARLRASNREVDVRGVESEITTIRVALGHVTNINTKVTEGRKALDVIRTEADALRDEVHSALVRIEDALRLTSAP